MLLDIINRGDLCPFVGVILVLIGVGNAYADVRQKKVGGILALLSFLGYGMYGLQEFPPSDSYGVFLLALRSLIVFWLTLGLSWVVLPLVMVLGGAVWRKFQEASASSSDLHRTLQKERTTERRRLQEEEAWTRAAPERERAKMEADIAANTNGEKQKRCENARIACELLFQRHAHALGERFPKTVFDEFMTRYLGIDRMPEDVEEHSKQLQDTILQHVASIDPPVPTHTIESLTAWYERTKTLINSLPVVQRYKQMQLAHLNKRYVELMQQLLEGLQP